MNVCRGLYTYTTVKYIAYVAVTSYHYVANIATLIVDLEVTNFWFLLLIARVGSATYWPSPLTASSWTRTCDGVCGGGWWLR